MIIIHPYHTNNMKLAKLQGTESQIEKAEIEKYLYVLVIESQIVWSELFGAKGKEVTAPQD